MPAMLLTILLIVAMIMPIANGFSTDVPMRKKKLALVTGKQSIQSYNNIHHSLTYNTGSLYYILGGNKGIGKEIARRIGTEPNFTVIIACRDLHLGRETINDLRSNNNNNNNNNNEEDSVKCDAILLPISFDLTNKASIENAATYIAKEYNGTLDVLINNAATCYNSPTLYGKTSHTTFENQAQITIDTNYFGTLHTIQCFLPLLHKSTSQPRIINIASSAGRLTILQSTSLIHEFTSNTLSISKLSSLMNQFVTSVQDGTHTTHGWPSTCYGVSKLGIIALTKVLARQYTNIKINSVDPGYCKTDQNNNQGNVDPYRGAKTPYLLALMEESENNSDEEEVDTGLHFYEEEEIPWTYQS